MRRLLALTVCLLLLISGCAQVPNAASTASIAPQRSPTETPNESTSSGPTELVSSSPTDAGVLSSVRVVAGSEGQAPEVTFDTPLEIQKQTMALLTQGEGAQVALGQEVSFRHTVIDALTGKTLIQTFSEVAGGGYLLNDTFRLRFPKIFDVFTSAQVGAYIAEATPERGQPAAVTVYEIEGVKDMPDEARLLTPEEVAALVKDGQLPVNTFAANGAPSITIPPNDAPLDLAVQVLSEGTGEIIGPNDTMTALYTGWTWVGAQQFDSAYDRGQADTYDFQSILEGWFVGLTGQKVGSVVQLSIPDSMAYGQQGADIGRPAGPLVYVIKIVSKV